MNEREALLLFEQLTDPDVPDAERGALLYIATHEVRSIVRELEAAANQADSRLSTSFPRAAEAMAAIPELIGPYRLVEPIGEGGMGQVWRAERDDGLFEQIVAIKLLSRSVFSEASLAQFADERRIFARLRHPHVAQMFDGGVSANGVPYIIMELIAGEPIDRWADRERLPVAERIGLLREAAEAVGYAHRNLIVHADVKPSNVVVEAGFGVKLLDFGIARLLDDAALPRQRAFTHAYASPARVAGEPPTPADDIFAMGRLLRQLVVDQPGCDPDLLAIADKAAGDPDRRYGTMAELVGDLDRWRTYKPVSARAPTRSRAARLFWRRNRLWLGFSIIVATAALVALAVITILWSVSERQRVLAEQRYAATRRMANYIIDEVDPGLAHLPGALAARERLLRRTGAYLAGLEQDRDAPPALKREIAAGYLRMAKVYGLDMSGGLGNLPAAWASLARANRLLTAAAAADPDAPELLNLRARAKLLEAEAVFTNPAGKAAANSVAAATAAQGLFRKFLLREPGAVDGRLGLWAAEIVPDRALFYLGRDAEGLPLIERDLVNANMRVRTAAQRQEREFNLAASYLLLGEGYKLSHPARALDYYGRLIDRIEKLQAKGASDWELDVTRQSGLFGRALLETRLNDHEAALRDNRLAVEAVRRLALTDNGEARWYLRLDEAHLADSLARLHRYAEARQVSDRSLAWLRDHVDADSEGPRHRRLFIIAEEMRAEMEDRAGARAQACLAARQAVTTSRAARGGASAPIDAKPDGLLVKAAALIAKNC